MRRGHHVGARLVEHRAPLRRRRLRAQAQERQARGGDDRGADPHREIHHDGRDGARQDVAQQDGPVRRADAARGLDVGQVLEHQRVAAHQPREGRNAEHRHGEDHVGHAVAQDRHDADRQQDAGKGEQHIADAHDDAVPPAFVVAGEQAEHRPDEGADDNRHEAGLQRDPRAHQDAAEDVAAERIDAEPVRGGRPGVERVIVEIVFRIERHQVRRQDRRHHQRDHEHAGAECQMLLAELAPELAPGRADGFAGGLRDHRRAGCLCHGGLLISRSGWSG